MATAAELEDDESGGEYHRPDAKRAFKIFKEEIAPKNAHMATIKGDLSDPYKRIKDECHFPRKVMDFLVGLDDMEEAKRDHWLLALNLGLTELNLHMPRDLVTMADGKDGSSVVPTGAKKKPSLVAVPTGTGDETDLADAAEEDFEASEEELAQQEGRRPADGTGAAAIAAMNAASAGNGGKDG